MYAKVDYTCYVSKISVMLWLVYSSVFFWQM